MAAEAPRSVVEAEDAPESVVEVVAAQLAPAAGRDAPGGVNGRDPPGAAARPEGTAPGAAADPDGAPAANGAAAGPRPSGRPTDLAAVAEAVADGGAVDPPHFAAAAVLDVLRATGWADAAEAEQLRAEVGRLRELLDMVIRDHRARAASAAGVENQQLHWLVPLLRSAYGVAFGTLGAKVALRTAIQEVPPEVLASAGLRLDQHLLDGPEPER
jgi:hypothetical protein